MIAGILCGFVPLIIWLYLLLFHHRFWRLKERDTDEVPEPAAWPSVVAVVPARNEVDVIQISLSSLLAQDYPGAAVITPYFILSLIMMYLSLPR